METLESARSRGSLRLAVCQIQPSGGKEAGLWVGHLQSRTRLWPIGSSVSCSTSLALHGLIKIRLIGQLTPYSLAGITKHLTCLSPPAECCYRSSCSMACEKTLQVIVLVSLCSPWYPRAEAADGEGG